MKIRLQRVHYMPEVMEPGVLYVSEEFGAVAHLCPCGCGSKVRTPLGPTDWILKDTDGGPTLYPSISNWQFPCQSHYWIIDGQVVWSVKLTPYQIVIGQQAEEERSRAYYDSLDRKHNKAARRFWHWLKSLITK